MLRRVARPLLWDVLRTKNYQKLTPVRLVIKRALGGLRWRFQTHIAYLSFYLIVRIEIQLSTKGGNS